MKEYKYKCHYCNKEFILKYKNRSKSGKCYCSNQCRANESKNKHYTVCNECGVKFHINWSRRNYYKIQFCTKQCYWIYKKKTGFGSNCESLKNAR